MAKDKKNEIKDAIDGFRAKMEGTISGKDGAYIATVGTRAGWHGVTFGGAADLLGMLIMEVMARVAFNTPGLDEEFISMTASCAVDFYRRLQEGFGSEGAVQ